MAYKILFERPKPLSEVLAQVQQSDGILLEFHLPHFNSLNFLRQLKEQMGDRCPPIVVIDQGDTETAVQAFKNGAVDYLVRDRTTADDLRLAMRSAIENAELRRERQRSQERFQNSVENMLDCFGIFSAMRDESGQIIDFRIDYLNAAACENNQMPKRMQIGRGLCEILPTHRESDLFNEYCHVVETGKPLIKDSLIYADTDDDHRLIQALDIRATKFDDGFVASWRDVTDRKRLELELNHTVESLQQQQNHKQAEAAIQQLNQELTNRVTELQTLLDILPVGITIATDPACTQMQSNAYIRNMLSVSPNANVSKSAPANEQPVYRVFQNGKEIPAENLPMQVAARLGVDVRDDEFEILLPDGRARQLLAYTTPLYDEQSQIRGAIGAFLDITERKQTEAALKASQQRYQELAEAMPQIVWTADATGAVNYWNQRWYEYTGLSEAESFGLAGVSTVHPDDRDRTLANWSQAIANGESFKMEYRIQSRDGEYHWFISRAIPTRDDQGQVIGWIGTITDIDNQKQAEIALQQSQDRLNLAMTAAGMGSWDWDIQTGKVNWSTNLERLFGIAPGSFDGRYETVRAMIHPDDLLWVEQAIHRAVYNREEYNIEFRFIKPDGTVRWALGLGRVFYDAIGNPVTMAGVDMDISERKQVEAVLRASEVRFREMADNAPVMIWVTDATGYCTYLSKSWYEFTGQTEETGLGFGWLNAVHPEDYESSRDTFLRANERYEAFQLEYRLRRQDGVYRWAIDAATPWFGEDGEFKGYIGSVLDISDRKQAEEILAVNEARLRGFVDANVVGILYGDIYGGIHEANDELLRIVGYTREDLQAGKLKWIEMTPLEYLPLDEQGVAEARAKGACTPYEKEYIRKDGSRVPVLIGYSLLGEAREETVVFILDLSDRKQAEAALRESENRLRLALESAELGTWDLNPITGILKWDDQCKAMFGLSPEAEVDYDIFLAGLHPEDRDRTHQIVMQSFDPTGAGEYDTEYRTIGIEDGIERWVAAKGKAFFDATGTVTRFIGTVLNITDKKRAEAEREQLLQREQTAREAAERANRIKDEFLAVLSHELRSPLNPILGWTKLLQMRKFDEAQMSQALATIERNAKLQTQLIDDLLDVAKILRGKLSLNITSVNLSFVIESAIETVRAAAVAKSISLHSVLPNLGQVSGDAARLQQVVWNLLSNAIKFTPNGGQVDIQVQRVGNQAELTVRDTGKGINPSFLPYIFESFRQEDASITRKYGGLGLGLAIVRQLVEAHGGTIKADSPGEGLGATFTVQLPLLSVIPETKQPDELPQQDLDLTGIRILTVDDDPDARELLMVLLTQYGAEVLAVATAAEVLVHLQSFQPDVLVSDIGMPGVDGYTLIQQVRVLSPSEGGQIPAIALTAYARDDDHQRAISSGYQRHVTKPLEPEQLVKAVVALTQRFVAGAESK